LQAQDPNRISVIGVFERKKGTSIQYELKHHSSRTRVSRNKASSTEQFWQLPTAFTPKVY
jgi:hypothetical protein